MEKILIIGKSNQCDIVIHNETVSRQHAQLVIQEMVVEIIDLESTNGTFVNGERIYGPRRLKKGDKVVLGVELFNWEQYVESSSAIAETGQQEAVAVAAATAEPEAEAPSKKRTLLIAGSFVALVIIGILIVVIFPGSLGIGEGDVADNDNDSIPENVVEPGSVDYDFSCLENEDDGGTTGVITILSDIEGAITDEYGEEITVEDELEFGKEVLAEMDCSDNGPQFARISRIKEKLVDAIPKGSEYIYDIHLIEEDEINAFTCGGQIFVYTGIIDFCENDNELAAIIAHEIAHNELGHIKRKLSQMKTSNEIFGEGLGDLTASIYMMTTMAFGQKLETHCDLWGIDLAIKAGYDGCEVVNVWERMDDSEYNVGESMIRSHPFSSQRADCCEHHLDTHHPNKCKNEN